MSHGEDTIPANAYYVPAMIIQGDVRSILSFVGIVVLISGVWYVDRTWDEEGSKAYNEEAGEKNEGTVDKTGDKKVKSTVTIPEEKLDKAFPFPWAFILGWILVAIAQLFECNHFMPSVPGVLALLFSLALGGIASVPMGDAVRNRKAPKKKMLGMMFVLSWILLAVFTGLKGKFEIRSEGLSLFFCLLGAILVVGSMKILWKHRKMGDWWETYQRPNPDPVVYNMGGPLFVFGFFLYWFGMNGQGIQWIDCKNPCATCGLPIFFNWRTWLTVVAGCGMVPVVMCLDCAHDSGAEFKGFGTDGKYFGRFYESPIPFMLHWTLFGFASLISISNGWTVECPRGWIILVICIIQGWVAGVKIQTCLYNRDLKGKQKWAKPFVVLFLTLAVMIGFKDDFDGFNPYVFLLGILGAIFVILGQMTVFKNRVKGDYWMSKNEDNPDPIVYSVGEPLFMFGWILLSLGMSINY